MEHDERPERTCPRCGDGFTPKRYNQRFCTKGCKSANDNQRLTDGFAMEALVKAWIGTRHAPKGSREAELCRTARRELTQLASALIKRDRENGRAPAHDFIAAMDEAASMVLDRVKL